MNSIPLTTPCASICFFLQHQARILLATQHNNMWPLATILISIPRHLGISRWNNFTWLTGHSGKQSEYRLGVHEAIKTIVKELCSKALLRHNVDPYHDIYYCSGAGVWHRCQDFHCRKQMFFHRLVRLCFPLNAMQCTEALMKGPAWGFWSICIKCR